MKSKQVGPILEMNPQQKRLYLLEQKRVNGGTFSIPISCELEQKLSVDILTQSLTFLIERHKNFHFKFSPESANIKLLKPDLNKIQYRKFQNQEVVESFIQADCSKPFNLRDESLYRFFICETPTAMTLYFNIHHLIWDGTSTSIFLSELDRTYRALKSGENPNLPTLPEDRYQKYLEKRQKDSQDLDLEKEMVSKLPVLGRLQLPLDFERPKHFHHLAGMSQFKLDSTQKEELETFCREHKLTLYEFFSGVFAILLFRYSAQTEFYQGTPLLGRHSRDDMRSLGFYVQTGLIPCHINPQDSALEFFHRHKMKILETRPLAKLALDAIIEYIDPDYDSSRPAGFQSFFMYQDFSQRIFSIDGVPLKRRHLNNQMSQSELDLWIAIESDGIVGGFHYPTSLFKETSIELMQQDLLYLAQTLSKNPNQKIAMIGIAPSHHDFIKTEFHHDSIEPTVDIVSLFLEQVKQHPSQIAVQSQDQIYSYRELDQLSDYFAAKLSQTELPAQAMIIVALERNAHLMIALLGILKAGKSYIPIDYKFPKDRIDYMLEHSEAEVFVTDHITQESFPTTGQINLTHWLDSPELKKFKSIPVDPNHPAYTIYTSGSTGKPKGVTIPRAAMSNFLLSMREKPGIQAGEALCAVTTLSFDISVLELYLPLISGAKVYIASHQEARDSQKLAQIIDEQSITCMQATPITWRLLFNSGWDGRPQLKVLCGGEQMPRDLAKELIRSCQSVWNMYGPTEATVWSTCKQLRDDNELISIGSPIRNTSLQVLDSNKKSVPLGALGELYIGGEGLALGYLKRQDLTDKAFINWENQRLYRTGDQARFTSWSEVLCLGRLDHQVKIRGHRIELGEIEFQLGQISELKHFAVIIREDVPGDKKLVAYLSVKQTVTEMKIKEKLALKLPPYMIPEIFVFSEKMPMTPNGKIDHKNLPKPYAEREFDNDALTPPRTSTEKKIAKIWQDQLGIPHVYLEDNFFDIGGNSLAAAGVFQKISQEFKCNLELALLFEFPNLTLLASEVDAILKGKTRNFSNIIKLHEGTNGKHIFFFHAIGGNTLNYRVFTPMAKEFNAYGVQSDGVDGFNIRQTTVEAMAENYTRQILEIDPHGPYYLVGGSLGGLLAYEVARLLRKRRKQVMPVIMFDTAVPQRKRSKIDLKNRQEKKSFRTLGVDQLRRRLLGLVNFFYRQLKIPTPLFIRIPLLEFYNFLALKKYRPKDYDGDLYMIRIPIKERGIYSRKDLGWGDYIHGKIECDYVDVPHHEFIESQEVAELFGRYLKEKVGY